MSSRTFGKLEWRKDRWIISDLEPHVAIRLKSIFSKVPKSSAGPFDLSGTNEISNDLEWFIARYPLEISNADITTLTESAQAHRESQAELDLLFSESHDPREFKLNGRLRDYQARGVELYLRTRRLLVGDAVGLGKTLIGIGSFTDPSTLPALVVVQAHLPTQWAAQIARFLGVRVHIIKGTTPYPLPQAEVYITTYHRLTGWVDVLCSGFIKSVVFDECQELRRSESAKHQAAKAISEACTASLGLSATPVYNYGDEIFNVFQVIKPGALGGWSDFSREWCGYGREVKNPKALGTYLREQFLFVRRTRDQVKRELPPINKIIHTVGHDEEAVKSVEDLARTLALKVTTGTFIERGEAARELDLMMRMITGVSKAKFVAEYVKILLENDVPVLLVGWHRDVYEIWLKELSKYNPQMYTGSESATQKDRSRDEFISGRSNLLIMSLRSGIGLDGLQKRCCHVVFGELDWSPAVHEQVTGRLDRDGQENQVTAVYLVSDGGSDPLVVDLLGFKSQQSQGIVDPFAPVASVESNDSRIKALAQYVLSKTKRTVEPQSELSLAL